MNKGLSTVYIYTLAALILIIFLGPLAFLAHAGTVENMERERAILIETLRSPDVAFEERANTLEISRHRLIDLERVVLRDESLKGRNTPTVRRAFSNYDLTFLVHASSEKQTSIIDTWLTQLGITTQTLMSTRIGRQ